MIKVGLVGEDPSDTSSIKNLLEKKYKKRVQFYTLIPRIKGYQLDTKKFKDQLPFEVSNRKCDFVILIRDLDGFESEAEKLQEKTKWFEDLNALVNNKGILLLNIWELEALILGDISTFNKEYKSKQKYPGNPMLQKDPKEFLKRITFHSNKKFHESHCPELFKKLNIDMVEKNCSCFSSFIAEFDKKLTK